MPDTPNKKFYLTTPIYYVNARPHIGHAYSTIAADVIARRHRLLGDDTFFLTGTDEHGQKVQRSAAAAGIPPQQFADQVSKSFEDLWKRMGITNDDYIRTTDERHKKGVQHLWRVLEASGDIYLSSYTGAYCVSDEAFVDLPAGTPCPDCGRPLEIVTEENYFFKLSAYQERLIDLILSEQLDIQPASSRNEVLQFLAGDYSHLYREHISRHPTTSSEEVQSLIDEATKKCIANGSLKRSREGFLYLPGALKDLSISRTTFDWGIPVPTNPKHVVYVWLDALANYITAIGYGSDDPADKAKFEKYWPADLHLVGKEITRFHCVYWPAFLMAAGIAVPKSVVANGWLLFEESKMSKSRGNVVKAETILDAFGNLLYASIYPGSTHDVQDLFASDVLRYFLLREIPFGQDGSFSFDALITRYNADLANGYGNLVSRTLSMIAKRGGIISEDYLAAYDPEFVASDVLSYSAISRIVDETNSYLDQYAFSSALAKVMSLVTMADGYMTQYTPWKLVSSADLTDQKKAEFILGSTARLIRIITALLYPVMPYATASVWRQLGLGSIEEAARNGELKNLQWGGLKPGTKLGALAPIFPRADKGLAQIMTDMENPATPPAIEPTPEAKASEPTAESLNAASPASDEQLPANTAPPTAPTITIDDFVKIDLRVAQIVVAERIPRADKLLRLEVDLGYERRQILSGIAEFYTPEELLGKRIAVIANLAPRKMRGLESHGMLLAASGEDHSSKPILATFSEEIALGSKIR